ncbi:hypothetical protein NGRA_1212, partial [Nosema granulosis]
MKIIKAIKMIFYLKNKKNSEDKTISSTNNLENSTYQSKNAIEQRHDDDNIVERIKTRPRYPLPHEFDNIGLTQECKTLGLSNNQEEENIYDEIVEHQFEYYDSDETISNEIISSDDSCLVEEFEYSCSDHIYKCINNLDIHKFSDIKPRSSNISDPDNNFKKESNTTGYVTVAEMKSSKKTCTPC